MWLNINAEEEKDPFEIATKPHGHGDVHMLLHSTGTAEKWSKEGRKWIVFFQVCCAVT